MLSNFSNDIRYAARRLAGSPGFTLAAILTIALGVGLNTGVFSVLNGIFLSDLPVPAAGELVDIYETVEGVDGRNEKGRINRSFTTSEYRTFRDRSRTLSGLLGYSVAWPVVLDGERTRELVGRYVTCNYFDVLRQPPAIGRALSSSDCEAGANPVVLLSHELWTRAFGADPAIAGRTLTLNGRPVTVAGVAAEDAHQPALQKLDFFAPISLQPYLRPDRDWLASESFGWLTLIGRRAGDNTTGRSTSGRSATDRSTTDRSTTDRSTTGQGTTDRGTTGGSAMDRVRAELNVIAASIDRERPGRTTAVFVDRAKVTTNRPVAGIGVGLTVAGALAPFCLVLLVACANVANLFLARTTARTAEIALRRSLGASRSRIVRQLLAEILLVSVAGGVLGMLASFQVFHVVTAAAASSLPVVLPAAGPDVRVLSFALALSLGAGIAAGLGPALRASNAELGTTMKHEAASGSRAASGRLQGALIGAQVGVCMVLLIAAGLLLRGLQNANTIDPGFPYRNVAVVTGDLRDLGYVGDALAAFQRRLADEVRALPGVAAAGYSVDPPWADRALVRMARVAGQGDAPYRRFERNHVSAGYFAAVGIPIVRGRAFEDAELAETSSAVIVTETTAESLWPGQNPIGRTLLSREGGADRTLEVVGVARDAQVSRIGEVDTSYLYLPPQRDFRHMLSLVVGSERPFSSIGPEIQAVLRRLDVALNVTPLEANLTVWRDLSAVVSGLATALGALALALAAVGIFGVVSFVVSGRLREIGIRLALGAKSRDVLRVILSRTMRPVVIGAAIGGAGAVALSGVLSSMLFGVSPVDPIGVGGAVVFVLAIAFAASVVPAWRGARVDPMRTLRNE